MAASSRWEKFSYRNFYDLPREIVVPAPSGALFLSCQFDELTDDYSAAYAVYWLSNSTPPDGSWEGLASQADEYLGQVRADALSFDPSRRDSIDLVALGDLADDVLKRFAKP